MTVREALGQAAARFDEGEADEIETARTLADIFARCPENIPPNECKAIKKIIADAVAGEVVMRAESYRRRLFSEFDRAKEIFLP